MHDVDDLIAQLDSIQERIADMAIDILRESVNAGAEKAPVEEKKLAQARRAVEKAAHHLREVAGGPPTDDWG